METNLAKPTAVSAQLPETLYCIACEGTFKAEQSERGLRHPMGDWKIEPTFCYFPDSWMPCPPPEVPEAVEVGEDFFDEDWAAQPEEDDFCPDEVGMWED